MLHCNHYNITYKMHFFKSELQIKSGGAATVPASSPGLLPLLILSVYCALFS